MRNFCYIYPSKKNCCPYRARVKTWSTTNSLRLAVRPKRLRSVLSILRKMVQVAGQRGVRQ